MILSCQKGEIMSLLIKTLVINDTNDISKLKELKDKRVKIILLNETCPVSVCKSSNFPPIGISFSLEIAPFAKT